MDNVELSSILLLGAIYKTKGIEEMIKTVKKSTDFNGGMVFSLVMYARVYVILSKQDKARVLSEMQLVISKLLEEL